MCTILWLFCSFISKQFMLPVIFSKVSTDILICLNENSTWRYSSVLHLMSLWCTAQDAKIKCDELQDVMSRKSGGGAIEKYLTLLHCYMSFYMYLLPLFTVLPLAFKKKSHSWCNVSTTPWWRQSYENYHVLEKPEFFLWTLPPRACVNDVTF